MKSKTPKTFEDQYLVEFKIKNKDTGSLEIKKEPVWAFGKEAHDKVKKKIENKYRGQGFKVEILNVTYV